ncbi:hypothetical protein GCM10011534_28750 [Pseudooceanicola nanhaiensis]|jgi:uncharacterized caspase-like protein|uniref:Caspase family p20 domain-containing protein n=1 Tax=Pseudooceanicola nanhaiensis TaxID=375761 RepID=A0A917SZR3_9RHOB|nr:caspase family protein [Pseudooceanicola nanhaiensis]GGM05219.1 hypothetical protein GCM10011534_28750 [Pseudooceanicola nanhaiensis]
MKFVAFMLILLLPAAALAERRVALVIGNDRYESLRPLANAGADADAVADALDALGFEVFRERDRDLRRMRRALEDLEYDGAGADVALVYFAGHGFEVAGDNRLLAIDGDSSSAAALMGTSLSLTAIRETVARIAQIGIVLVDACREDPFAASGEGRGGASLKGGALSAGFAPVDREAGTLVGFATAPGDTASDGTDGHSPFAAALVRHLGTPGLEVRSVLTLVQQEVYDRTAGDQLPYVESALPRLFFAAEAKEELPERERLLLAMAGLKPGLRAEVEAVAAEAGVPLAPLYGAVIGADLGALEAEVRAEKLAEAARAFTATRDRLRRLSAADGAVADQRDLAADRLRLGDFGGAMAALDQAADLDRDSASALEANLVARRVSVAETLQLKAGVARSALDYDTAREALKEAAAVLDGLAGLEAGVAALAVRGSVLSDLGDLERDLGNTKAALAAYVDMFGAAIDRLAGAPDDPDAARGVFLARMRIGGIQRGLGLLEDALDSFDAGLTALGNAPSDDKVGRALDLWTAQTNIAWVAHEMGLMDSALQNHRDAAGKMREALERAPGRTDLRENLGLSHEGAGDALMVMGEIDDALEAYEAARDVFLDLREVADDGLAQIENVGRSAMKGGDVYMAKDDLPLAVELYTLAVKALKIVRGSDAHRASLKTTLAESQTGLGEARLKQGDVEAAKAHFDEALGVIEPLVRRAQDDIRHRRIRADVLLGHAEAALAEGASESALDMLARAEADFEMIRARQGLGVADLLDGIRLNTRLGEAHERLGQPGLAVAALGLAADHASLLHTLHPTNLHWRERTLLAVERAGLAAARTAHPAVAFEQFDRLVGLLEEVEAEEPAAVERRRDLALALMRRGEAGAALGETDGVAEDFAASLEILRRLMAETGRVDAVYWAAYAESGLAFFEAGRGNLEAALDHHRRGLGLREMLIGQRPEDAHWRWLLSASHEFTGNALLELGRTDEAAAAFRASVVLREALAGEYPDDHEVRRGLFASRFQLAEAGVDPMVNYARALSELLTMRAAGLLAEADLPLIEMTEARMAALKDGPEPAENP